MSYPPGAEYDRCAPYNEETYDIEYDLNFTCLDSIYHDTDKQGYIDMVRQSVEDFLFKEWSINIKK